MEVQIVQAQLCNIPILQNNKEHESCTHLQRMGDNPQSYSVSYKGDCCNVFKFIYVVNRRSYQRHSGTSARKLG